MSTPRPWRVLVPITLHYPEVEEFYARQPDLELEFALPPEHRVFGGGELGLAEQRRRAAAAVRERVGEVEVVGSVAGPPFITDELLSLAPRLRVVYISSAGYDSIDVDAATRRGIVVVNAAGHNAVPVAEHTLALALALVRKLAVADRMAHAQRRGLHLSELGPFPGMLRGRTLGLVGLGAIGRAVARLAAVGFGMDVVAHDPFVTAFDDPEYAVELLPLEELLERADVVSVHVPLSASTHHLIDARALRLMRPDAFLLNTSRGGTVDTDALVTALRGGWLAGAGLDVTDPEPLPAGHPLLDLDNVVITPHAAGAAAEAVLEANLMAAQAVCDARRGRRPKTLVNPEVWDDFVARLEEESDADRPPSVAR